MADVLVSPIVELLFSNLTCLISTEFGSLYGVKKDLEKLSSTLATVLSVLDDAETKQIKDKSIRGWLRKLKDAAYEAEDIMDDCALEFQRIESEVGEPSCGNQKARHVSVTYDSAPSQATLNTIFKSQSFCRTILFQHCATSSLLELFVSRLSQLEYLRVLDLSNLWTFSSLPPIFGRLTHLRYLNLSNMNIASLPKSVCNLRNLQILVLSHNLKLTTLPPSIGNLKQLRCLDLYQVGIRVLPESICCLTNLQTLNLEKCRNLKMLPKNLSKMRKLRKLAIRSDNYININMEDPMLTHMPLGIGELTCLKQLSTFVVSQLSDSAGIQELEKLDHLEGELTINGIQNVLDPRDAYKASLRSKENLLYLCLRWLVGGSHFGIECNNSKEVLEALQPHLNIKVLFIKGYPGAMLPGWVGSSTALPKLTFLGLYNMPNVEGWSSECLLLPSCLQSLALYNCPKLKLPTPLPSSITRLSVGKGNDPSLESVENLHNLFYLRITGFDEVETLPEAPLRNLTRLQQLEIYDCDKLKRLPTELENLSTVTELLIYSCGGLESLTEGLRNLTSLKELRAYDCRSLKSLSESSLQHLTALQKLEILNCPELEVMSVDFQHLISLEDLLLGWLPQLTSLPEEIQHARRLQTLEIMSCKNLRKLPEWLLELPALTSLRVIKCHPELHRRCEDWNRIPHIRVENRVEF
ncbi:hypothetical protein IFM89_019256 [Coptis chinensis]|uniref:Rx N-terminal domain-containing protein n=1 Tax=Coptis chinensis TaxID=261450 RepID=A0A835H748_9MAGN|nr:hypothetical protein IFM89_019256 [Coptis chinensis]